VNFDFSDDQQAIKRTAREFLESRFGAEKVRELAEAGRYDEELWREMSELGWPGIFIPESHGGQGLGTVELVILLEELGYALAPCPFLSNAAAGLILVEAGSDEQRERWLPGIASGEARGTAGLLSNGEARLVPDADSAELIVLLDEDSGTVVEHSAAEVQPLEQIDLTRRYARVRAADGEPLPADPSPARHRACVALAAELVGVAQRAMEMAVEYARERKQFDRPVGSYQAVSHRCAQMLLEVESARSATYYAAWTADAEPDSLALAASMAKAYASDAGWRVTASALQVLGGIGFTWEHDLHFFLKRAKVDGHLFGSAREHRDRVAELAGIARAGAPASLRAEPRPIAREAARRPRLPMAANGARIP
jgi:alkylation response protein AidB-like acyl-CoA dehydrogenase